MKKVLLGLAKIATFITIYSITQPAIARMQVQLPPEEDYIFFLRRNLASDPATAQFKITDQALLKTGKLWCKMIKQNLSLNDLYQFVESDPKLGQSAATIKLHRAIIDGALWSLCSEMQTKIRNPDARN
jgi:hypothetical protein